MRELEIKFALTPALRRSLAAGRVTGTPAGPRRGTARTGTSRAGTARAATAGVAPVTATLHSRYFDTPDGALAAARATLRVRRHADAWLQTAKLDRGSAFERFEWEQPIAGPDPQRDALPPQDIDPGGVFHREFGRLEPLFETEFERTAWTLAGPDGLLVELAQDVGDIRSGAAREPIRELELEAKDGSRPAFFEWALDWAVRHEATLLLPTKAERGLRLAARLPATPIAAKAAECSPAADAGTGKAAAAVIASCIAHFCANLEPVAASAAPEGPHQLRVALRRLRAALRFFELHERDDWRELDAQARALADDAASVRDADVFSERVLAELQSAFGDDPAVEALASALVDAREAARGNLRTATASPRTTRFVLQAMLLAERLADGLPDAPGMALPFGAFAFGRLQALDARLRRRVRRAADDAGWHRARIAVKDLRYALGFGAAALPRQAQARAVLLRLSRWQDRLGAAQDAASARAVAAAALAASPAAPEVATRALALVDGWRAFAAPRGGGRGRIAKRSLRALRAVLGRRDAGAGVARVESPLPSKAR